MNKKGISPVVSTLLLIVFAVVLGIVVMSWGKAAQLEEEEQASCEDTGIDILTIGGKPSVCRLHDTLKYTVENTGSSFVDGLKITLISDDIEAIDEDVMIMSAEIKNFESAITTQTGISKIKFTPRIISEGKSQFCPKKGVELEIVEECR